MHLASRLPYPRVHKEVRWLLLNFPAKAATEPEAIPVLIDGALPDDVSFQLKVGRVGLRVYASLSVDNGLLIIGSSICSSGLRLTQSLRRPSFYLHIETIPI